MSEEFVRNGNILSSSIGFSVELKIGGGISYSKQNDRFELDTEWIVKPQGIILYKGSRGNKGFDRLKTLDIDRIFEDATRALKFLGYEVQIWSSASEPGRPASEQE